MSHDYSDKHSDTHSDDLTDAEKKAFASLGARMEAPSPDLEDRIVSALRERGLIGATGDLHPAALPDTRPERASIVDGGPRHRWARTWWQPLALAASIVTAFGLGIGVGRQTADDTPMVATGDVPPIVDVPITAAGDSPTTTDGAPFAMRERPGSHGASHDVRGWRPAKDDADQDAFGSENDFYTFAVAYSPADDVTATSDTAHDAPFVDVGDPSAGFSSRPGVATIVKGVRPSGEPRRIARP